METPPSEEKEPFKPVVTDEQKRRLHRARTSLAPTTRTREEAKVLLEIFESQTPKAQEKLRNTVRSIEAIFQNRERQEKLFSELCAVLYLPKRGTDAWKKLLKETEDAQGELHEGVHGPDGGRR